jgi:hypothetical protein
MAKIENKSDVTSLSKKAFIFWDQYFVNLTDEFYNEKKSVLL